MSDERRYLVCPSFVNSRSDGDRHFITARRLMQLYGVNPRECLIADMTRSCDESKLIHLHPKTNGDYTLPKPERKDHEDRD